MSCLLVSRFNLWCEYSLCSVEDAVTKLTHRFLSCRAVKRFVQKYIVLTYNINVGVGVYEALNKKKKKNVIVKIFLTVVFKQFAIRALFCGTRRARAHLRIHQARPAAAAAQS